MNIIEYSILNSFEHICALFFLSPTEEQQIIRGYFLETKGVARSRAVRAFYLLKFYFEPFRVDIFESVKFVDRLAFRVLAPKNVSLFV